MFSRPLLFFLLTLTLSCAAASTLSPSDLVVRNSPGKTASETLRALRRYLTNARIEGRQKKFSNSTSLDKSFDNAVLFKYVQEVDVGNENVTATAGINIVCTKCYIKGNASAHLTIDGPFNATKVAKDIGNEFEETFDNLTTYAKDYVSGVAKKLSDGFDTDDFDFPPLNITFDIDVPQFPECQLGFGFDGFEMYMQLDTTLSAGLTYTLNLYTSQTPLGSRIGDDLLLGVVFSIDLILSVEAEIQMTSGFHIKMDDQVAFDIALFSRNVSSIAFNGGKFEFLPVVIESAGAALKAVLRVGINAGIEISSPVDSKEVVLFDQTLKIPGASAGIEVSVFANIAELSTNVTVLPEADEDGCVLRAVNAYQFALGAAAGASVEIGDRIWGPTPNTQIPIFFTTLENGCASRRVPTASTVATMSATLAKARRDEDLTTSTLTKKFTYTGVECLATGVINCPPASQTLRKFVATETIVSIFGSGTTAVFPQVTQASIRSLEPFGSEMKPMISTSGTPQVYTPPVSSTSTSPSPSATDTSPPDIFEDQIKGIDKKVIIGVSVGASVLVLAALIGGFLLYRRRRKYSPIVKSESRVAYAQGSGHFDSYDEMKSKPQAKVYIRPVIRN
ncbi:glycolate oxidase [Colletotrichum truncatum]|uniref:Glycolate oxidase n=1 Tax=Colletotrichum truncatum TaxID=5467 RepID=A0ACC3ZHD2_COLTU|nr:glycolate oxidase [Colletotrichum truncatum]KAF6790508.1 glycolate oxidase [Colletotrichum truncatum]